MELRVGRGSTRAWVRDWTMGCSGANATKVQPVQVGWNTECAAERGGRTVDGLDTRGEYDEGGGGGGGGRVGGSWCYQLESHEISRRATDPRALHALHLLGPQRQGVQALQQLMLGLGW